MAGCMVYGLNAQALKVGSTGNVGIGLANPTVALEIQRTNFSGLILRSTTGTSQIRMQGLVTGFIFDDQNGVLQSRFEYNNGSNQLNFFNDNNGGINFQTNSLNLHWNQLGRLGVGTNVPTRNLHVIGNAGKTDGTSTWDILSDKRVKQNIKDYTDGLAEIMAIRPVTFEYNGALGTIPNQQRVGIIAQEMQEIAPYMITETKFEKSSDGNERSSAGTYLTYSANALPYMLINAIQDQQEIIEEKEEKLMELTQQVEDIERKLEKVLEIVEASGSGGGIDVGKIKTQVELKGSELASLSQNRPNPFQGSTVIDYEIPSSAKNAELNFYSPNGQLVKTVAIDHTGVGELTFRASDVPSGVYSYTLVIDGNEVSSKLMVLKQ